MGGWKTRLIVADLDEDERLEATCRKCSQIRYIARAELIERAAGQLFLDEVEARARCRVFGCSGKMRLARMRAHKVSAFIGGMA